MNIRLPLLMTVCAITAGCGIAGGCDNRVVQRSLSPDGSREAVVFERNCGATTGYSTQISLMSPGKDPANAGNLFIELDGERRLVWNDAAAAVRWTGPATLEVLFDAESEVFKAEQPEGLEVEYARLP